MLLGRTDAASTWHRLAPAERTATGAPATGSTHMSPTFPPGTPNRRGIASTSLPNPKAHQRNLNQVRNHRGKRAWKCSFKPPPLTVQERIKKRTDEATCQSVRPSIPPHLTREKSCCGVPPASPTSPSSHFQLSSITALAVVIDRRDYWNAFLTRLSFSRPQPSPTCLLSRLSKMPIIVLFSIPGSSAPGFP